MVPWTWPIHGILLCIHGCALMFVVCVCSCALLVSWHGLPMFGHDILVHLGFTLVISCILVFIPPSAWMCTLLPRSDLLRVYVSAEQFSTNRIVLAPPASVFLDWHGHDNMFCPQHFSAYSHVSISYPRHYCQTCWRVHRCSRHPQCWCIIAHTHEGMFCPHCVELQSHASNCCHKYYCPKSCRDIMFRVCSCALLVSWHDLSMFGNDIPVLPEIT